MESEETNEPVAHQIEIQFKAMPALFVTGLGAGTLSVAIYNAFAVWLLWGWRLSKNGRRPAG